MKRSVVILVLLYIVLDVLNGAILSIYNENCAILNCDDIKATNIYMAIDRFKLTVITFAFFKFSQVDRRMNAIALLPFAFALNELMDELFCDPTKLQLNELIIGVATLLYFKRLWNKAAQTTSNGIKN